MEISERYDEKVFSVGDKYTGNFKGLLPHGEGRYTWLDGTTYDGNWDVGKITGKGKIVWSSGATYEGEISGGYLHGHGTFTAEDGSVYTGGWRMNTPHGVGKKKYSNFDAYEGTFKEGIREGSGRYTWHNGNSYMGNWKKGEICGRGVMKWANGDLYDGYWLKGVRHGSGIYRFADGGFYFGTWTRGLKDGRGTFYPSGSNHPSLKKWSNIGDEVVDVSRSASLSTIIQRSLSDNTVVNTLLRNSGRISHRTASLNEKWSGELSCTISDEDRHEFQGSDSLVYEREYVQGVLIKEKIRDNEKTSIKAKNKHKDHGKEAKKKSFVDISIGHRSYHLMLNLQVGIRYTVGKITPVPMREVRSSDFGEQARIKMYFPRKGSRFTPPHKSIDFYWKDYCPMVFRNLREMFKLDAAEYMMSICGDDGLRELSSPGKSGSIFYLSHDDRFVIKTLKKSELKVLLRMLPSYYNHVGEHENTLITKFFGVHRIKLKGGRKVRFVVMGNMFCTELRIHRRYDLKGSTVGRHTAKDKISDSTTLKDLDLLYEFHMDRDLRESFFNQISLDCKFLESQQIIDYSLLLGLHFRAPEHLKALLDTPNAVSRTESSSTDGGILQGEMLIPPKGIVLVTHEPSSVSTTPGPHSRGSTLRAFSVGSARFRVQLGVNMPAQATHKLLQEEVNSDAIEMFEVYDVVLYMGIIDILQEYNMKKKVEHFYKSMQFDPQSISSVDPKSYAERFIGFLKKVFPANHEEQC